MGRRCLALPGKGRCGGAGATLFAPVGQRRCCVARLILAGLRGKGCCGAVCLSGRAGRRAGRTGAGERSRQGMDIHVLRWACRLMGENAPFPRFAARGEGRLAAPSRDRHIPLPSRGENGGLCPHPPKGPVPWVSLFGGRPTSPPSPHPPKRRRRQAPARGPAAVCSYHCPNRTKTQHPSPPLVGLGCVDPEPKALAPDTVGHWLPILSGCRP